jgi:hypothetical protein
MKSALNAYINGRSGRLAVMAALLALMTTVSPAESKLSKVRGAPPACPTSGNVVCCGPKATSNKPDILGPGNSGDNLLVYGGACMVNPGTYNYHNINIYNGGTLQFADGTTNLSVANILIENGGTMLAGSVADNGTITPIAGPLTITLYGADQGPGGVGITCQSDERCGVPADTWKQMAMGLYPKTCTQSRMPGLGNIDDCFYQYDAMPFDNGKPQNSAQPFGYYGYKVIGVGYGGSLQLYGKKGATYDNLSPLTSNSTGTSWERLNNCASGGASCMSGVLQPGATQLVLSSKVDWQPNDNIVISTTDYLPDHAEQVQILTASDCDSTTKLCDTFTFAQTDPNIAKDNSCPNGVNANSCKLRFPHNASMYSLGKITGNQKPTGLSALDTRAAVGLLTRSIRIVSGGDGPMTSFPPAPLQPIKSSTVGYYFGGHMVIRQGFQRVQIQGVEFYQMGQGGKLGHYPVHFHMSRKVPTDTFVKDNSVWDSMTRWIVLHATQGVLLDRNVGYASIGHGYYLEDGTETDNKLYANLGVLARAAITNNQNPRNVPGILAAPDYPIIPNPPPPPPPCGGLNQPTCPTKLAMPSDDVVPFHSDWDHPSVFWIMNGWNDFEYNMAAGAGTCGVCYWLLPAINSGMSRNMSWQSYASEQQLPDSQTSGGTTPLQIFTGNTCVSAMGSFLTIGNATACNGVQIGSNQLNPGYPVLNPSAFQAGSPNYPSLAPSSQSGTTPDKNGLSADNYYPHIGGGGRFPTRCPASGDCSTQKVCSTLDESNCVITNIDHYMTSFNWAETNFAAVWLRPMWYLFINSAITDVQNGGITFVTGGGYTQSDVINGHWALARKSIFVGNTQAEAANPFASHAGPFNPGTGLKCDQMTGVGAPGNYCLDAADGVSFAMSNFAVNQRLFSIYDGPAYEDSNAYLDITRTTLPSTDDVNGCTRPNPETYQFDNHTCANSVYSQVGKELGMPYDANKQTCYLPNAAIAWKQPNGFFYPPAFHSRNLFFDNVDIRHFVIEPLFASKGLFQTDGTAVKSRYCTYNSVMFTGFTDIDRQTELNDDEGTLTGLIGPSKVTGLQGSISVNQDPFFQAPVQTPECLSDVDVTPAVDKDVKNYPGTAVTSPYDYVTTVVFPDCAKGNTPTCAAGIWDQDCANQQCYGVPLYRENLLTTETAAVPIHLMGQSKFQRSALTTNNNRYYVDTTPSKTAQSQAGIAHFNVFQKGQTYYVFLLFAKNTTKQTYDIYVGPNFNKDSTDSLWLTRVKLPGAYEFDNIGAIPNAAQNVGYNSTTGVLTVTLDMSAIKVGSVGMEKTFAQLYATAQQDHCQPQTFCQWVAQPESGQDNCQCADSIFSPPSSNFQANECSTTNGICSWATKDVDCPDGGCFGFGIKLTDDFQTSDTPPNPAPTTQPFSSASDSPWNAPFTSPVSTSDACYYPNPPTANFSEQ